MPGCGSCASALERLGHPQEKIYPTMAVRYGKMNHIGEFSYPATLKLGCGAKLVISTERGIEIGEQVRNTCTGCGSGLTREKMHKYAEASGEDFYRPRAGRILRQATEADLAEQRHLDQDSPNKLRTGRRVAAELDLPMKVIECEHIFGGERVVFYFMAEQRIDFRELVRRLASEFQTRIEMRQVGARDEARLLADYETCGRECCCKNFLKVLKPVGMQMAKMQKATLDPSKVSGRCGRLKCCLRFEHETYEDLNRKLPRLGVRVETPEGNGRVIDRQVLTQLVKIQDDEGRIFAIGNEFVTRVDQPAGRDRRPDRPDPRGDGPEANTPADGVDPGAPSDASALAADPAPAVADEAPVPDDESNVDLQGQVEAEGGESATGPSDQPRSESAGQRPHGPEGRGRRRRRGRGRRPHNG